MKIFIVSILLVAFLVVACDSNKPNGQNDNDTAPAVGSEGGPCYPNGTCNEGLQCLSDLCVEMPEALNDEVTTDEDEITTEETADKTETITFDDDVVVTEDDIVSDNDTYVPGCGSGNIDDGETCELGDTIDCALIPDKSYAAGTTASCNNSCTGWLDIVCTTCGNGAKDDGETCEKGTTLDCASVPGKSYETGTLATCNNACTGWDDKDVCTVETPITCGNEIFDDGEELCETGLETPCVDILGMNYADNGNATCNASCTGWDDAIVCTTCGNGFKDGGETCETGTIIDCGSIAGKNYEIGTNATCNETCTGWNDVAVCTEKPIETCDNGTYDPGQEVCEKGLATPCEDIPGANYSAVGDATCNDTCTGWNDVTTCTTCGNGVKDLSELCEKGLTTTCGDIPDTDYADTGDATCNDTCDGWDDASACTTCGNGTVDDGETCDGGTQSCVDIFGAHYSGNTSCLSTCAGYNVATCVPETRTYTCSAKPATGTVWNTVSSYSQTWNGSAWAPADDPTTEYNTTVSTTACRYTCAVNYAWNGTSCVADTRSFPCAAKPSTGTVWNTVSSYTQTWNGSAWTPADSTTSYNPTSSSTECRYTCAANYSWNGSTCGADTRTFTCNAKPTDGTAWNTVPSYTQTWNGSAWIPADDPTTEYNTTVSTTECRYKCATNYTWNDSVCVANTRTFTCAAKPITGTVWNTVSSYLQTWKGSAWIPADTTTAYNAIASTTACRYTCAANYTWNGSVCVADTRAYNCNAKPADGTAWNTVSSYTQTWNGTAWTPVDDSTTEYNTTASATSCRYTCALNYTWNGSVCVANTRAFTCGAKPVTGTIWNTVSAYQQTWNGAEWVPADDPLTDYNTIPSTTECQYTCATNYTWNGLACVSDMAGVLCTGQTLCYNNTGVMTCPTVGNAFYGQDAQYAELGYCIPRYYTVSGTSGSDIVTDNITGLIWQRTLPATYDGCTGNSGATCSWQQAIDYCANLAYGGQTDWRLPTRKELATLPDYGRYNPAIDTTVFPGTQPNYYWSSSSSVYDTTKAWEVLFSDGSVYDFAVKIGTADAARCVRGAALPDNAFSESTVAGKVIVTDTVTGLVWTKEFSGTVTWQNALSYCENLDYGGATDWRLPNIEELKSLIDDTLYSPASSFPGMPSSVFWSSSSPVLSTTSAWIVDFYDDLVYAHGKANTHYARCVR